MTTSPSRSASSILPKAGRSRFAPDTFSSYVVELVFGALGLIPAQRSAQVVELGFEWNYTTWLNLAFRPEMLRQMEKRRPHGAAREHEERPG